MLDVSCATSPLPNRTISVQIGKGIKEGARNGHSKLMIGLAQLRLTVRAALHALACVWFLAGSLAAQTDRPLAPLDVSSPAATLNAFLTKAAAIETAYLAYRANPDLAGAKEFERLVERSGSLFDTRALVLATRTEIAEAAFGFMYDILLRLPPDDIASALEATLDTDPQSPWTIPNTPITILQIDDGEEAGSWLFSQRTLARLPEMHRIIIALPKQRPSAVENWHLAQANLSGPLFAGAPLGPLPKWLTHIRVLDTPLWKLLMTLAVWLGLVTAVLLWMQVLGRLTQNWTLPLQTFASLSAPLLSGLLVLAAQDFAQVQINLSGAAFAQVERIVSTLALYLSAAWAVWVLIMALVEALIAAPFTRNNPYHTNLLRLVGKVLVLLVASFVLLLGLNEVGVPALGLVAGLGVSGFAVALAGKSTLENLFGGLTLFADKPFKVGDFIDYQDGIGTVENIGPRSARLRGLDGTLTIVPNTDLVTARITNFTERNRSLFLHSVGLRYETTQAQLSDLLATLQQAIEDHPLVEKADDMPRVHLTEFGDTALMVEIRANILTTSRPVFEDTQQELLFKIMAAVEGSGARLATRMQTVLLGRDRPVSSPVSDGPNRPIGYSTYT